MTDRPIVSKFPIDEVIEAAEEFGPKSKLRRTLILLVTKIDSGFSAMLTFLATVRSKSDEHGRSIEELKSEIAVLKSDLSTLRARGAEENTARIELARAQGARDEQSRLVERGDKDRQHQLEWAKMTTGARVSVIVAALTFLGVVIGAVVRLFSPS